MPKPPTTTEKLFYGSKGASNVRNPFRLERDLIGSNKWPQYYEKMHQTVKEVVDNLRNPDFDPCHGCSIGIGFNEEVGWFVLGCGQGPMLLWTEDEGYVDLLASSVDEDDLDMEDDGDET
jgi:hypothetical protein